MRRKIVKWIAHVLGVLIGVYMVLGGLATSLSTGTYDTDLEVALGSEVAMASFGIIIGFAGLLILYGKFCRVHTAEHDAYLIVAVSNVFILLMEWFIFEVPFIETVESLALIAVSAWLYLRN